tara:strand:- start:114 stop:395 length:282 start_codon:yes stop_codon:yes gene_type:complete
MPSTALFRSLTLAFVVAGTAPQAAFAGHAELVQQHRFMRAELSGTLYLPADAQAAVATGVTSLPDAAPAAIIAARHGCNDVAADTCEASSATP